MASEGELKVTRESVKEERLPSSSIQPKTNKLSTIAIQYFHHLFICNVTAGSLLEWCSNLRSFCQHSSRVISIHDLDESMAEFCALSIRSSNSVAPNADTEVFDANRKVICIYPDRQDDLRDSSTMRSQFWSMMTTRSTYKMASWYELEPP